MRLVTVADANDRRAGEVNIRAVVTLELDGGGRVPLLIDRGWGTNERWEDVDLVEVIETTRVVVGPDEPFDDRTPEDMEAIYWVDLERAAQERGVRITVSDLASLRHDVECTERLLTLVNRGSTA